MRYLIKLYKEGCPEEKFLDADEKTIACDGLAGLVTECLKIGQGNYYDRIEVVEVTETRILKTDFVELGETL